MHGWTLGKVWSFAAFSSIPTSNVMGNRMKVEDEDKDEGAIFTRMKKKMGLKMGRGIQFAEKNKELLEDLFMIYF